MEIKKFMWTLPLALTLAACGGDSSTSSNEVDPSNPGLSSNSTDPVNPNPNGGDVLSSASGDTPAPSAVALPAGASVAAADAMYATWKNRWIMTLDEEKAGGSTLDYSAYNDASAILQQKMGKLVTPARVVWDGGGDYEGKCVIDGMTSWGTRNFTPALAKKLGCTVSEGIGYGMLLAAIHSDWDLFDALWAYNLMARSNAASGLMPWMFRSFVGLPKISGASTSALDADIDVATSLIIAGLKTGNVNYTNDGIAVAGLIYEKGINPENHLIRPGHTWMNKDVYNLSYFSPAALRLFALVDAGHDWNTVLAANYAYMSQIQDKGCGLFPDWSNAAGEPVDPRNNSAATTYMLFDKESVRIPWRIAWDMYWNQDANAQKILTGMANFITTATANNPAALPITSYDYKTGTLSTSNAKGVHYTGEYCLMGMGVNQTWLDACYQTFSASVPAAPAGYSGTYFEEILMNLFGSLMNGKFVKPY